MDDTTPPPPPWSEIKSDPSFQALAPEKQLVAFDRWHKDATTHATQLPDWSAHEAEFTQKANETRTALQTQAGGLDAEQARVKIAKDAVAGTAASHDILQGGDVSITAPIGLSGDEERAALHPLGPDVWKAYYDDKAKTGEQPEGAFRELGHMAANTYREFAAQIGRGIAATTEGFPLVGEKKPDPERQLKAYDSELEAKKSMLAASPDDKTLQGQVAGLQSDRDNFKAAWDRKADAYKSAVTNLHDTLANIDPAFHVDPNLKGDILSKGAQVLGGAAQVVGEAAIPGVGLPLMLTQSGVQSWAEKFDQTGGDEAAADRALVHSLATNLVFMGQAHGINSALEKAIERTGGTALQSFLVRAVGGTTANVAVGQAAKGVEAATEAAPGERLNAFAQAFNTPDGANFAQGLAFGLLGAKPFESIKAAAKETIATRPPAEAAVAQAEAQAAPLEAAGAPETAAATRAAGAAEAATLPAEIPPVIPPLVVPTVEAPSAAAPLVQGVGAGKGLSFRFVSDNEGNLAHELNVAADTTPEALRTLRSQVEKYNIPDDAKKAALDNIDAEIATRETPAAPAEPKIIPADGEAAPVAQSTGDHVVSTAVQTPDGILTGSKWNEPHSGVGIRHGMDEVPQGQRGFLAQVDGKLRFVGREEAGRIADGARQRAANIGEPLQSEHLTNQAIPTAADGDIVPPAQQPAPEPVSPAVAPAVEPVTPAAEPAPVTAQTGVSEGVQLSKKPAPVDATKTPTTVVDGKVLPAWTNDPLTTIHQIDSGAIDTSANGKGNRLYIPDAVMEADPPVLNPAIQFATEKQADGSFRDYVTGVKHDKYGLISGEGQYREHYEQDPEVAARKEAQTKGEAFKLTQERPAFQEKLDAAPPMTPELNTKLAAFTEALGPKIDQIEANSGSEVAERVRVASLQEAEYRLRTEGEIKSPASIVRSIEKTLTSRIESQRSLDEMTANGDPVAKALVDNNLPSDLVHFSNDAVPVPEGARGVVFGRELAGDANTEVAQANVEAARKLGLFERTADPIRTMLENIRDGKTETNPGFQRLAELLLGSKIDTSVFHVALTDSPKADFAGHYNGDGTLVTLNLAGEHPRSFETTALHEIFHVYTAGKLNPENFKLLNPAEKSAVKNLVALHDEVARDYYRNEFGAEPTKQELASFLFEANKGGRFYGISNVEEFAAAVVTDPAIQRTVATIKQSPVVAKAIGKYGNVLSAIVDWVKTLFTGKVVGKGTALEQAVEQVLNLATDSGEGRPLAPATGLSEKPAEPRIVSEIDPVSGETKHSLSIPEAAPVDKLVNLAATLDRQTYIPEAERTAMREQISAQLQDRITGPQRSGPQNAVVDQQRLSRGLPPRMEPLRRALGTSWTEAMKRIEGEPGAGRQLVKDINSVTTKKGALSDVDTAILAHEQVTRENSFDNAVDALNNAKTDAEKAEARTRLANARDEIQEVYNAADRTGTLSGQSLAARKILLNTDYTLARMEAIKRAANDGKPLTEKQLADVKAAHEELQAAKDKAETAADLRDVVKEADQLQKLEGTASSKAKDQIKKELAKKAGGPLTNDAALARYKKSLQTRMDALEAKIAAGDFSKNVRNKTKLDQEALDLQVQYKRVRDQFDRSVLRDERSNRPIEQKGLEAFSDFVRGIIISSPVAYGKLLAAAATRFVLTPAEELAGSVIGQIPGLKQVAKLAPREGGSSVRAEANAVSRGLILGVKDAIQIFKTGKSDLDILYGRPDIKPRGLLLEAIGRSHYMIKAPALRAEFERSLQKRTEHLAANAPELVNDPMVQHQLLLDAYKDGEKAIFKNSNRVTDAYKAALAGLERPNKATGKTPLPAKLLTTLVKTELPVVGVPTNIVAETGQFVFGSVTGLAKFGRAVYKGIENLHPDEADQIMRHLKKGSIGGAAMALAFFAPPEVFQAGGFYQRGEKRGPDDIQPENLKLYGVEVDRHWLHNPLYLAMQVAGAARRSMDSELHPGKEESAFGASAAALLGLAEAVPFTKLFEDVGKVVDKNSRPRFLAEMLKSDFVPQALQWAAKVTDKDAEGKPIKRRADFSEGQLEGTKQTLESGIPGLRQNVPEVTE